MNHIEHIPTTFTEEPQIFELPLELNATLQPIELATPEGTLTAALSMGENGLIINIGDRSLEISPDSIRQLTKPFIFNIPLPSGEIYSVRIIWIKSDSKLIITPEHGDLLAA